MEAAESILRRYALDSFDVARIINIQYGVRPLFLSIVGSHALGTSTATSDLDIRGVYLDSTRNVLSLNPGKDTIQPKDLFIKQVDLQLYELAKMCRMLLNGNGNIVEMLCSPLQFFSEPNIVSPYRSWGELGYHFVTRQLMPYYIGYHHSQRKRAAKNRGAKSAIYTYRELMLGAIVMDTGEMLYNLHVLTDTFEAYHFYLPTLHRLLDNPDAQDIDLSECEHDWERMIELLRAIEQNVSSFVPQDAKGEDYNLNKMLLHARVLDLTGIGF